MATGQPSAYRVPFPNSQVGQHMYNARTHSLAMAQGHHPPNLTHSATSAFRPAGVPQVPLQQRLVSPGVIPSNQEQYHQQRTVPCGSSGKHAMQLGLHQKQQHFFQNQPAANPANRFQEISVDGCQRGAPNSAVQAVAPVQYPSVMHRYSTIKETSDSEALHQELRMLHAVHYQDVNRKDEIVDTYWKQKFGVGNKQRANAAVRQTICESQRYPQIISNGTALRKKFFEETHRHAYGQQAQAMYLTRQGELYQERKNEVPIGSSISPTHLQMAQYPHTQPETHVKIDGAKQQHVPHLVQAIREGVSVPNNTAGRPINYQRYHHNVPQQLQTRNQGIMMPHQSVKPAHQEVLQNQRMHRNLPSQIHAANIMDSTVRHKQENQSHLSLRHHQNYCMVPDNAEQMPVKAQVGQVQQMQTVDNYTMVSGHMHSSNLSGQIMRNRICENVAKKISTDDASKENRRLSKMAVSIKEEQKQLKEVLEKSLSRAAVHSTQNAVPESLRSPPRHIIAARSCGNESMPRIVKVQSLADQESNDALTGAQSNAPVGISVGIPRGDGLGVNLKPSKPKSVMIKAHQELQELPLNVNRVPSIGSLDSDNGRKDSWDSGIESPPWPENREVCVMNMKRAASFTCDEKASLSNISQRGKLTERKSSDNSLLNAGLDMSTKDLTNIPVERSHSVPKTTAMSNADGLCSSSQESSTRNRLLVAQGEEKRSISRGPIRLMNRKRSLPIDGICPVEPKVMNQDPQAVAFSRCMRACDPEEDTFFKAGNSLKGQTVTTMIVEDESPLDLSLKKDHEETYSEIKVIKEVCLVENQVTVEKGPNEDKPKDPEESGDKLKKGEICDGEESTESDKAVDGNESVIPGPENQMQGYFGTIMMRALQRLWSETIPKLDGEEATKSKSECVESSDDDSGKYFQPSSVTTLKNIPRVDSPVRPASTLGHEILKDMPSSCSSPNSLEIALCELMQQSSGAFKHGGDIFQHFDRIIKRELMIEIEKQPLKGNGDSTTEKKHEEIPSVSESDLHEIKPGEKINEASVFCSRSPSIMVDRDEMDDSQNLVIVESSPSPKSLPDTQVNKNNVDKTPPPASIPKSLVPPTSVSVESPISESFMTPGQMYEKAAREAAQKAANEAAQKAANEAALLAAQKTAQNTLPLAEGGVSQAQSGHRGIGDASGIDIISEKGSLLQKPSPAPSHGPPKPKASLYPSVQLGQRNSLQLQNNERVSAAFVNQPEAPAQQRPQFMGQDIQTMVDVGEAARDRHPHALVERRYSESAIFKQNGKSSTQDKVQRIMSDDSLIKNSLKNFRTIAPSNKQSTSVNNYHVMPQTVWQAQAHDDNANKVKLVKVTFNKTIPVQAPPSVSSVPNAQYIQKQLQKSPIVLLPKLVCIEGRTYSELTPVSGTQTCSSGIIIPQKDNKQSVSNNSPVLPTVSVQGCSKDSAPVKSSNSPLTKPGPEMIHSPDLVNTVIGPFHIIQKAPVEQPSSKKPSVSAFTIIYKKTSLPGVLRSGVPFVPPRLLQVGMFPEESFEEFCHALQDCNIMQRYMTVLERSALFSDLKHNKISSCKLVSLEEFHQKYENIKVLMQINKMT